MWKWCPVIKETQKDLLGDGGVKGQPGVGFNRSGVRKHRETTPPSWNPSNTASLSLSFRVRSLQAQVLKVIFVLCFND